MDSNQTNLKQTFSNAKTILNNLATELDESIQDKAFPTAVNDQAILDKISKTERALSDIKNGLSKH